MDELNETMVNDNVEVNDVIEAVADHDFDPKVITGVGLGAVVVAAVAVAVTKRDKIKAAFDDHKAKREEKKAEKLEKKAEMIRNNYVVVEDAESDNDEK